MLYRFGLEERRTAVRREVLAGITTFATMAYVLAVQPAAILGFGSEQALTDINGMVIDRGVILMVCALFSGLITLVMGLYANLPLALSCGMGSNFMLGALVQSGQVSFGWIMTVVLAEGILLAVITLLGIQDKIVTAIPKDLKVSTTIAVGFFTASLGFQNTGIGNFENGINAGDFTDPAVLLALGCLALIAILYAKGIPGAILISIAAATIAGIPLGVTNVPGHLISAPSFAGAREIMFSFDLSGVIANIPQFLVYVFIGFSGLLFAMLGTTLSVCGRIRVTDEDGNYARIRQPFLAAALGTIIASAFGCTEMCAYVESNAGVSAGGRTGLTSVVTGLLFFAALFLSPVFLMFPDAATGPVLIFVGFLMLGRFAEINFSSFSDSFGPAMMILFCIFTGSLASGICTGVIADTAIKVSVGKWRTIHPIMYLMCIPMALYFVIG